MDVFSVDEKWWIVGIAVIAILFVSYSMGYSSGKDRALRDNRNDDKNLDQ